VNYSNLASYKQDSFNIGAPGGSSTFGDGVWSLSNPDQGFLTAKDEWLREQIDFGDRRMLAFNITPLNGSQMSNVEGELLNFSLSFSEPGIYSVELTETYQILQTYYQDTAGTKRRWGTINRGAAGVPRLVYVR
jgi:hypothetical protein